MSLFWIFQPLLKLLPGKWGLLLLRHYKILPFYCFCSKFAQLVCPEYDSS